MSAAGSRRGRRLVRVLIVDDSAYVRRTLRTLLLSSREVEVVGAAVDGHDGLQLVEALEPDVVTLDLEMPRLDGFAFLRILMRRKPLPVIVVSSFSERQTVLRALELGALDFVAKPERAASPNLKQIRGELVDKVLAGASSLVDQLHSRLDAAASTAEEPHPEAAAAPPLARPPRPATSVLAVGTSTGGPSSLRYLLSRLPADYPAGIVIAQHMPPRFTRAFAQRLDRELPFPVREAESGRILHAGEILIAPGGSHTEIRDTGRGLAVSVSPAQTSDRYVPSVDRLLTSLADAVGPRAVALIMTGMGSDGAMGVQYVHLHGGQVLAEAEESAVVFGMPRAAVDTGAVDHVLPLGAIVDKLVERSGGRP
jgi:two-component system chemotaxis response regulator CheB